MMFPYKKTYWYDHDAFMFFLKEKQQKPIIISVFSFTLFSFYRMTLKGIIETSYLEFVELIEIQSLPTVTTKVEKC